MDFTLNSDQQAIVELAQQFARDEMLAHAASWDEHHEFPIATLKKAASLGLAAMVVAEDVGGSQLSRLDAALVFTELATACPSTAAFLSIHNMVAWVIDKFASDELRRHWCPRLARMDVIASYCLTEPSSGSDAASLKTTAVLQDDHYILNGAKSFISGGSQSDVYLVMARTDATGAKGITCFLVEKDTPGLSFGKREQKLGWHSQPTTMVFFEDCKIPKTQMIGELGRGFNIALQALNGGRINIAACSLGGAKACLRYTKEYMHERQQFQKSLTEFQALQFRYVDCMTEWEAAKLLVQRAAASLDDQHPEAAYHAAMAKQYATDVGFKITDACLQLYGGYGYLQDYPIERYFRDLRVHRILEGTNEIMRIIMARHCLDADYHLN